MSKVKIFITYKEEHTLLKSNIFTPIQTGRDIASKNFDNMLGDNTGDNISFLNPYFCETTAIYWVWKHYEEIGNPESLGFMHYRRHFLFGEKNYKPNFFGLVKFNKMDETYLQEDLTSDKNISEIVSKYDAIFPRKINVGVSGCKTNYEQYEKNHIISDYDKALKIIEQKYPEYLESANEYSESKWAYFLDMFIMKKDLFFKYCNWLFDILFELKNQIDYNRDCQQNRAIGYISERLTGIFFTQLKKDVSLRIAELPVSFIDNALIPSANLPISTIPIVLCCSNYYVPYLSVFLESISEHIKKDVYYHFIILNKDISTENKKILENQVKRKNVFIDFINANNKLLSFSNVKCPKHVATETYFRLLIPQILPQYDKCLYLDLDMICLDDLENLYNTNLNGKSILASPCAIMNAWYYSNEKFKDYVDNVLQLDSDSAYFQAGVLVLNLKKMRDIDFIERINQLYHTKSLLFADQCILNDFFKNDVGFLNMQWNYEYYHKDLRESCLMNYMSPKVLLEYINAKKNPKIIHFQGDRKPWFFPDEEYADIWWEYARKTPFYEQILYNMTNNLIQTKLKNIKNKKKYSFNYKKCNILKNITVGNAKKHYTNKAERFKELLSKIED